MRSEMGEAMANVLGKAAFENKIYTFTGDRVYSFYDIASSLTELSDKEVKYTDVSTEVFEGMMKEKKLPEGMIQKIIDFMTDIKHNQEAGTNNELELALGRKPTSLKEVLRILFNY